MRNLKEGISLHKLPFYNDDRTEAKKRRKKWVDFVRLKRAKWQPSQSSVPCSEHLKREDFVRSADLGDEQNLDNSKRWLRTDDFGVCVFHSVLLKREEFQKLTEECCENSKQHREALSRGSPFYVTARLAPGRGLEPNVCQLLLDVENREFTQIENFFHQLTSHSMEIYSSYNYILGLGAL